MKRICFAISVLLFLSWVSVILMAKAGMAVHALVLLSVLFLLQAIMITSPKVTQEKG